MSLTQVSLFAGIGGMDLAAHTAGVQTIAFVEWDNYRRRILARHWPEVPIHADVRTFTATHLRGRVGIVAGGPPCPEFSGANKHASGFQSERGQLVFEHLRIAKECAAPYILLENAARIVTRFRSEFISAFDSFGYNAVPLCLQSGAFHARKRGFYLANTDQVGGIEKLHEISTLVSDQIGKRQAPEYCGIEFILRADADPVFLAERDGESLVAPVFCREDDGIPYRVDRVAALGDSVVPTQIAPIYAVLARELQALEGRA